MWVYISFILLKTENNKKIISNYYSLMKLLFICLFALFMSWTLKKIKNKKAKNADVMNAGANPNRA